MISEKKKLKVFLCHANADDKRAIKLYIYLLKHGVQPRRDKDVKPGEVKETAINSMMNESDAILILLSQATTKEEGYMQKQIKYAMEKHKEKSERTIFLIPIKLEECEIPIGDLTKIQSVNWFEKKGPQYLMKALAQRSKQLGGSQISIPNETDPSPDLSKEDNNILESSEDIIMRLTVESDNLREQLKTQSYLYEIKINLLIKENEDLNEIIVDLRIRLKFSEEKTNYLNQHSITGLRLHHSKIKLRSSMNKFLITNQKSKP